ncbi:PilZ domain-containing protein [Fluoribacter dumoffii]|uniref:Myxococcus xanthus paralogous domain n=1 Tax=Fluoribacter dumoffii TaxID=463 RepID=A0A377G9V1_9GAMM|nr:PilZ domain-containing protein [Fluoribacter dumoffii]KTC89000.1 type 4 fimbrial biogenesis protein PilZ [Fluoribacter dumoffii NY 23]MCW8418821.1 PilZ domain-containing protein [Fluoribacter dumoffii]MCW8453335.1 PilZ domain-containing protein [Fluoribacter dumoffii]MCW8459444.1 PilZ domain-containing protein [Fluoribacter dumoffii]MCW8482804.1 PilZ domain-containing protein [Fluoribacter dumoffii]
MDTVPQINCSFPSESTLYSAYMPFVKGGGLFIRTHTNYQFGSEVKLSVKLMDEDEPYVVDGKIVWITPRGAQGNKVPGIGVQLIGENSRYICNKIETYLAGMLKSSQYTDTI